ncbi:major facilitator superfamily domain-containing protein [Chytriomyces cf. hyalinus JEL632]|nr:major facilitator superfamily domain-containing protein [Chytriomyces cf. hyalinus JEL632]
MHNPSPMLALITLVSSCFAMATAGAMFSFSVVANSLKDRLNISSTDLNTITAVGNSSLYLSFLAVGPVYDRVGARWTLILGAAIYCLGYALMYLGYEHKIASTTAAMSVYYFIVGIGSTCSYMGCIGANVKNFNASPHEGKVLGLLLLFYGLSASLFAQIANAFFADRGAGALLLFSAAVCGIVNLLAGCFTFEVGTLAIVAATVQVGEAHGNRSTSVHDSAKSPAASIRPNANGAVSHIDIPKPGGETVLPVKTFDSEKVDGSGVQLSPVDILRHPLFWCLSATFVFMQGLTYITNFVTILEAAVGEREATEHADRIVTQNSIQVTVMSVFNSLGRLTLPIFCEVLQKRHFATLDRSMLLLACQVLIFIPTATLATGAGSEGVFYMSSILISYGFGGAGALFPVLTKDFFGMHAYGTACAFVMAGVPVGIFISNVVFGRFYDSEAVAASKCFNNACYSKAYIVFSALQGIAILAAGSVVVLRLRVRKSASP